MSNIKTETCPHCGNKVRGEISRSFTNKATRVGAKGAIGGASILGMAAEGAAIGSAIPVVGTAIGGIIGAGIGAVTNTIIGKGVDAAADAVEDNLLSMEYEFVCPNCGHTWTRNEDETSYGLSDETDDDSSDDFSFGITEIKSEMGYAAVEGFVYSGCICTESKVIIKKKNGKNLIATVAKIFDDDYCDGDFCEYVDSESSGCTLYLEGVQAYQIDEDDDIEEYDENEEDDDTNSNVEQERFKSFFDSYLNEEYASLDISDLSNMFVKEAKSCSNTFISSQYYCVAAVACAEYFVIEWLNNRFKNYPGEQQQLNLQKKCLVNGFAIIQKAREILPEDKEYHFVSGVLSLLKDFWVDSCYDKALLEEFYGDLPDLCKNADNFMFNTEWLNKLYTVSYNSIIGNCKDNNNLSDQNQPTESEKEYLDELKDILADGEISSRERRLLDKIRNKLGISEKRAAELEASLSNQSLTQEEQEYLDEYKEIISEGGISARDQRFLDKLKKTNGISEQRAKELEMLCK